MERGIAEDPIELLVEAQFVAVAESDVKAVATCGSNLFDTGIESDHGFAMGCQGRGQGAVADDRDAALVGT